MKVLSTGFNNQRVTFDRNAKNTTFYRTEEVGFRTKKRAFAGSITFLLSSQEICC